MRTKILDLIEFEKVNILLEGFNKATGFVAGIVDLDGKVVANSGWRRICTDFHRVNSETTAKCIESDTCLASQLKKGEKYNSYNCLNGLVDVAVPIIINEEHIGNLFSGQFFHEEPDLNYFSRQAEKYGFDKTTYLEALEEVPVVSEDEVRKAMDFLLYMTQLISESMIQRSELIELNKTLKKSEVKFKSVFDSANVGKSITLPTGEIDVNAAFCDMLGYTWEELQNKKWQDLTPKDEIPYVEQLLDPVLKGEIDSVRFEKRYICKNGNHLWADVSTSIIRDEHGESIHFISTIIDITENKEAKKALQESEIRFKDLHNASFGGITIHDNGLILDCNKGLADVTGYSLDEFIGMDLLTLIAKDSRELVASNILADYHEPYETVGLHKNGQEFPIRLYTKRIPYKGNQVRVTEFRDISEQKQAEKALIESEDLLRKFMDSATDSFALFDAQLNFIVINKKAEANFGLINKEIVGKNLVDISPDLKESDRYNSYMEVIKTGQSFSVDDFTIHPKFGSQHVNLKVFKVGEGLGIITSDITERKLAEEKIREKDIEFRKLSSNMSDLIFQFKRSQEGSYSVPIASEGIQNIFGCSPKDVLNDLSPIISVILPEDAERIIREIEYSAEHLTNFHTEFRVQIPGKKVQWTYAKSTPEKLADGSILWYGFVANITERKQAEALILQSKQQYDNLVANIPGGVYILRSRPDFSFTLDYVSPRMAEILDVSVESLTTNDQAIFKIIHPEDLDGFAKLNLSGIENKQPFDWQGRVVIKGAVKWLEIKSAPMDIEGGDIIWNGLIVDITEQKQAEAIIKESEAKYKMLFDLSPNTFIVTRNGVIEEVNNAALEIFGIESKSEMIGTNPMKWVDLESFEIAKSRLDKLFEKSTKMPLAEYDIIKKNGEVRQIDAQSASMKDEKGLFSMAVIRDVTERNKTALALQKSNERIRSIFDEAPLGIALIDSRTSEMLEINDKYCEIVGRSRKELLSMNWISITHPDDLQTDLDNMALLNAGDLDGYEMEKRYIHKNGSTIWINLTVKRVSYTDNKRARHLAMVEDITQKKLAESALRESEEKFKKLMEGTPLPICLVNKDGEITFRNNRFNRVFGYSQAEVPSLKEWWKKAHPDEKYRDWVVNTWESALEDALAAGADAQLEEIKVTCKDDSIRDIIVSGISMEENFLATFIDITERKLSENELREHKDNLEKLVEERTKELENKYSELERMNKLFVGRELRMIELKEKIRYLESEK